MDAFQSECVHLDVLRFNASGIISTHWNTRMLRKHAAQVEISSSVATEMLDYTLKRRSARNNCLWKACRGSEVPLKWFGILSLCYFLSSRAETTVSDTAIRGPRERETPALQLTSTVHSRSVSKPAERQSRYPRNRLIFTGATKIRDDGENEWAYACCFYPETLGMLNDGPDNLTE